MKKFIVFLLLPIILLTSCSANKVTKRPENTELEFWITEDVGEVDFSNHNVNYGFGVREYYGLGYEVGDEEYVSYHITAYPDYANGGSFVTRIEVTDPNVKIIGGLTCKSETNLWNKVLTERGFENKELSTTHGVWESGKFMIRISQNDGKCSFMMSAEVTNRLNIVF